jgi:hypothetical protein
VPDAPSEQVEDGADGVVDQVVDESRFDLEGRDRGNDRAKMREAGQSSFTLGSFTTTGTETADGRREGGHGNCIPGAATVIAKLHVLILRNANML